MTIYKQFGSMLTGAIVTAAFALPGAAQARPNTNPAGGLAAVTIEAAPATGGASGFQWDDAGIGAATAGLVLFAAVGATGSVRRRRFRRTAAG